MLGNTRLQAADAPANPSFAGSYGLPSRELPNFGTFRQGAPGTTIDFDVYNRPGTGPTSPMSLYQTHPFPILQTWFALTGPVSGVSAGGQAQMHLALSTSEAGDLAVSYILDFSSDSLPPPPATAVKQLALSAYATVLPRGDFNGDKRVDGADFVIWRKSRNTAVTAYTRGDANGDAFVDDTDYTLWRSNYGAAIPTSNLSSANLAVTAPAALPEPTSVMLGLLAVSAVGLYARTRSRS